MDGVPLGGIIFWPGDPHKAPDLLLCDGATAYTGSALAALLGARFGEHGSGSPLLPDLQGRFARGAGRGDTPGTEQASSFHSHDHQYTAFPADTDSPMVAINSIQPFLSADDGQTTPAELANGASGCGLSDTETRPANIYLHFMISPSDAEIPPEPAGPGVPPRSAPIPVGSVILWAGGWTDSHPAGWLPCTGDPCPKEAPELQSLLSKSGNPFGATDGVPLLPNLGGQFVRGVQLNDEGYDPDYQHRSNAPGVGSTQGQTIASHHHEYGQFPAPSGEIGSAILSSNATGNDGARTITAGDAETRPANVSFIHLIKAMSGRDDGPMLAGGIVMYAGDQSHVQNVPGWHECDGQQFSGPQWQDLAKVLPDGYYPNLQGLFVRGTDITPPRRDLDQSERFRVVVRGEKVMQVPDTGVLSLQESALLRHSHAIQSIAVPEPFSTTYGFPAANGWTVSRADTTDFPDPASEDGKETRPANTALYFIVCMGIEYSDHSGETS